MCANGKKDIIGNAAGVFTNIRQRSAMNPFLWIIGILGTVLIASFALPGVDDWIAIFAAVLFTISIIVTLYIGIYFAHNSPNNLRSDEYQSRYDALQYLERSQTKPEQTIETTTIPNPELKEDK